jgi:Bifunctional DNA primase/polymerase, N-terminal
VSPRDAAIAAARSGWSTFPCRPRDKRPAVVDCWEQRARSDPEQVARLWPSDHHNAGVACGPSGLVVIDLDTHGIIPQDWQLPGIRDGRDVLARLCEQEGQPWPTTRTVATPTGGRHLIFAAIPGREISNSRGKIGPLIDVRGAGGYILAAGSVLDERAYPKQSAEAELVRGGKAYQVIDGRDPAPVPRWLADLADPPRVPTAHTITLRVTKPAGYGGAALAGEAAKVATAAPGSRNDRLNKSAFALGQLAATGMLNAAEITEALMEAASVNGLAGEDGPRRCAATIASGIRAGAAHPRNQVVA